MQEREKEKWDTEWESEWKREKEKKREKEHETTSQYRGGKRSGIEILLRDLKIFEKAGVNGGER